ncbi:MAG TPA: hypothetical protein VL337_09285 [Acidimicrobiales bacterium]|jgi:hypothetical protein|nr:hypothetical protein [Acidimicrobiales bacterium]
MHAGSHGSFGHRATPVLADDVARVVARALANGTSRIRLTTGQRLAILNSSTRPGAARA